MVLQAFEYVLSPDDTNFWATGFEENLLLVLDSGVALNSVIKTPGFKDYK